MCEYTPPPPSTIKCTSPACIHIECTGSLIQINVIHVWRFSFEKLYKIDFILNFPLNSKHETIYIMINKIVETESRLVSLSNAVVLVRCIFIVDSSLINLCTRLQESIQTRGMDLFPKK